MADELELCTLTSATMSTNGSEEGAPMLLRDVAGGDVEAYVRMRCDRS
jgi:hypothetical protein